MDYALRLGRRALGNTAENPPVGCVIVKDERVLGIGWTQQGGRPHAETEALAMAGEAARGATAYVTLEPCAHHGRAPPCAEALVKGGITRAVIALEDPDPRVSGGGLAILRNAGLAVELGMGAEAARRDLTGFLHRITRKWPQVILKLAVSADGKIAARVGERTTVTGPESWARVHLLRAQCDAILIGMETAVVDNPALDCRLPGLEHRSPNPFVMSRTRGLPPGCRLAGRGAEILRGTISQTLSELADRKFNRLLVEGGARLARSFLEAGVVDEVQLIRSPLFIGPQGVDALAGLSLEAALRQFAIREEETLGNDVLSVYSLLPSGEGGARAEGVGG